MNIPSTRDQFGAQLAETARLWRTRLDQRLRPLGLTQAKWMVLLHLSKSGDGIVQKELAERVGVEGATLVGLLDRMTADEWIERRESSTDRRCKTVHLTDKAQGITREIMTIARGLREELLAELAPEDLDTCLRVLKHIKDKAERLSPGRTSNNESTEE